MCLHSGLSSHLLQKDSWPSDSSDRFHLRFCLCLPLRKDPPIPSAATMYRSRTELDMASCIFARRHVLNVTSGWFIHLRADSSPQGGRDFFVSEYDVLTQGVSLPYLSNQHVTKLLDQGRMTIASRLLPLSIVGRRAASAVHKGKLLLQTLGMESADLTVTINRTFTMLFDFGAEAGLWTLQAVSGSEEDAFGRLFAKALPVADVDHGLQSCDWALNFYWFPFNSGSNAYKIR